MSNTPIGMGMSLSANGGTIISQTLVNNVDLFAWTAFDMPRVSPTKVIGEKRGSNSSPKKEENG